MKMNIKLSVIMPMYNVKDIVCDLKEATKVLDGLFKEYELIVVNDGSTNRCFEEAKSFKHKKVKVVGYKRNSGKGNAIKYGFRFANGEYIVFFDSGGDLALRQIEEFIKILKDENADIIIGSKRHPNSRVHYPWTRHLMSSSYQKLNKLLFNLNVRDTQVGLKLFKKEVLTEIMPRILAKKFAFDLELLVIANKLNFKIIEAPIILRYNFQSTINLKSVFWTMWDTAAIFYRLKILKWYDQKQNE
jgi:glycosyltransferase involved in cell wall biosynthesis